MDPLPQPSAEGSVRFSLWDNPGWIALFLALVGWQAWLTLGLFGPGNSWRRLNDEEPILSGSHPVHLYHGFLGARSILDRGSFCCYDPSFQAGYPKTPVFDSGSRPAEMLLLLAGGGFHPAAYKIGFFILCCLVPFAFAFTARALSFQRAGTCLAVAMGLLIWWGTPCRQSVEAGDLDRLLAGLAALVHVALLIRFDRYPGFGNWLGLLITAALGWFANPWILVLLLPLFLIYYLSVGARHALGWHIALWVNLCVALAMNAFWLADWIRYWWIHQPIQLDAPTLTHRTFHTLWQSSFWGNPADRALALVLTGLAVIGVWLWNRNRQRPAARLLGLGAGGFLFLAVLGMIWKPLGRLGSCQLLIPALWFAIFPAVHALLRLLTLANRGSIGPQRTVAFGAALVCVTGLWFKSNVATLIAPYCKSEPLVIGLDENKANLIRILKMQTSPDARILWEDVPGQKKVSRWSSLLPLLLRDPAHPDEPANQRYFLGGLDPDATIEHAYAGLMDQNLAGRSITSCSDAELENFCIRYNVGWIIGWSPATINRLKGWDKVETTVPVTDDGPGFLFKIKNTIRSRSCSYFLTGEGKWLTADAQHICLGDVVPENGLVVLSLHYQTGLRVSPARVEVERAPDPNDPIPFIRLRVSDPVPRLTLTWDAED